MISYIFKSKIKNIFVAIFSAILLCRALNEFHFSLMFGGWKRSGLEFVAVIPYLLVFLYMVTLKRKYKIKQFLFPIAFAILSVITTVLIIKGLDAYIFTSINALEVGFSSFIIRTVMLAGYAFCFVGSLSNFKKIRFLRYGLILCIITVFILGLCYYNLTFWSGTATILSNFNFSELFIGLITLSFYISILFLTFTKESEYIDLTPFIEARKLKKQMKKEKKLQYELEDRAQPPVVPEGSWRCMGCGEILPNEETVCKCGYKR